MSDLTLAGNDGVSMPAQAPADPSRPCHGPFCRQMPPVPVAPSAPVRLDQPREHAVVREFLLRNPVEPCVLPHRDDEQTLAGYPRLIERPPRLS